jgi:ATP-dependent Clp protease ATP-binding subunit ClpX
MIYLQRDISKSAPDARLPVKPTVIHKALDNKLSGLPEAKRFISTRIALHLRRALDLSTNKVAPDKNQCILIMGPSGSGKTFLIEQAAAIAKIPFVAASAASLTSEGYVGQSLSSVLQSLLKAASSAKVAQYGICFLDEWDKRVQSLNDKSPFSQGIQGEILRMMEGTTVELETRPGQDKTNSRFHTKGLMFVFAGAFEGIERLLNNQQAKSILGFSTSGESTFRPVRENFLREALVAYGMMPEFINRLSGILTLPAPTTDDMVALLKFGNGPVEACNKRLRGMGTELVLDDNTAKVMANYACETRSYCRGMQLVLQAAMDHLVYEGIEGQVAIEPEDMMRLAAGERLELTTPRPIKSKAVNVDHPPIVMTAA